jgi:hypothetical protein
MPVLASLMRQGGVMLMTLRHGPSQRGGACSRCRQRRRSSLHGGRACAWS